MKQSLKYGLLMGFVLLLHALMTEATDEIRVMSATLSPQRCSVSQARPIRNAIEKIYHFYSALSCDLEHSDLSHVPANKSFLRLTNRQLVYQGIIPADSKDSSHLYTHDPLDPIVQYIYGQRKIII